MKTYYVTATTGDGSKCLWDARTTSRGLNVPMSYRDAQQLAEMLRRETDYRDVSLVAAKDYVA